MSGMTLNIREVNSGAIFKVDGRLMYEADSQLFHEKLEAEVKNGRRWFVIDLSGVIGMSSTGLGILISAHRGLAQKGVAFKLAKLSEKVRSVLQITRLNTIFEIYETVEEAVNSLPAAESVKR